MGCSFFVHGKSRLERDGFVKERRNAYEVMGVATVGLHIPETATLPV